MISPSPRQPVLRLRGWLVVSHLLVLALPVFALLASGALVRDLQRQTQRTMLQQARLLTAHAEAELRHARTTDPEAGLPDVAPRLTEALEHIRGSHAGVRVLDAGGVVVATTGPGLGQDLSERPEVADALSGRVGSITRNNPPDVDSVPTRYRRDRLYLTVPVELDGEVTGAVLMTRNPREPLQFARNIATRLTTGAMLALLLTLAVGVLAAHVMSRSLDALVHASRAIRDGTPGAKEALAGPRASRIAEVQSLAEAFTQMSDRLQARLGYIAEFASNVSHEFKTPLSTLRGTVELLAEDDGMPPEQRAHFLANALEDVHRMDRLVSGLLELARAEEGGAQRPLDLVQLARDVADRYEGTVVTAPGPVEVVGSPAQLEAVLANLVGNAWHHGQARRVEVRLRATDDGILLVVDDDGLGISEANQAKVFDRFFTTDREGGGTGLGLAIVQAVCTAHGGTVTIDSEPGRTRVRVALPRSVR